MKRSRRELFIDMVIRKGIFKNNQITLFPCFTFIPKTGFFLLWEFIDIPTNTAKSNPKTGTFVLEVTQTVHDNERP